MNALITGVSGQDGSFLAELLLDKGYNVFGVLRRTSSGSLGNASHLADKIRFIEGDLCDYNSLLNAIKISKPVEVYNLAAQSHVGTSFSQPDYTFNVNGRGVDYLLSALQSSGITSKVYQASTSELFGNAQSSQNESTPFLPRSPYGLSKLHAFHTIKMHRDTYNTFACNGILFNHESERRGANFVTRKITKAVAMIKLGLQKKLQLGNIESKRDWGYAKDYVKAMYMIMQNDVADDFVIATGETHSVREFCNEAFNYVGLNYMDYVESSSDNMRPLDINILYGDPSKARRELGWKPSVSFNELVSIMVKNDIKQLKNQHYGKV